METQQKKENSMAIPPLKEVVKLYVKNEIHGTEQKSTGITSRQIIGSISSRTKSPKQISESPNFATTYAGKSIKSSNFGL